MPKGEIPKAQIIMADEVLPKFGIWVEGIQKNEGSSQYLFKSLPYFNAVYKENDVEILSR